MERRLRGQAHTRRKLALCNVFERNFRCVLCGASYVAVFYLQWEENVQLVFVVRASFTHLILSTPEIQATHRTGDFEPLRAGVTRAKPIIGTP